MARPKTERGQWGSIKVVPQVQDEAGRWVAAPEPEQGRRQVADRWRARTKIRDVRDGKLRDVERYGDTKTAAERALKAALHDRTEPAREGHRLRSDTPLGEAAKAWMAQVERPESTQGESTARQYRKALRLHVESSHIESLTLADVNDVPTLREFLQGVADEHGSGSARTARTVLSGILTLAVNDGVLPHNAVRDVSLPKSVKPKETPRDTSRAFTRDERDALLAFVADDPASQNRDVVDVVRFLAGTGVRIGEALAVLWADVDMNAATVHIRGTKSAAADRHLSLPPWLAQALRERKERNGVTGSGLLFPSLRDTVRDDVNVMHQVRDVLDRAGFEWATSHTFRRTVASLLHDAGVPLIKAADQLGHADPSMTLRAYIGRRGDTSGNASVL